MDEPIRLSSVIEQVEVYRSEALVTRRASANLAGRTGRQICLFSGLPLGLREDSARLQVDGAEGVRVVDLHLDWQLGQRESKVRTEANQALRDLAREHQELQVSIEREVERVRFLESLSPDPVAAVDLPEKLAFEQRKQTDALLELSAWVGERLASSRTHLRKMRTQRRDLLDRLAAAEDALARESSAELEALAMCRKQARVVLDLSDPVEELVLRLSYLVPGARWVPEYELRVFSERDEAELVLKALVAQATGDDWEKASLAFSTADLRRSSELPELDSWRIGKLQPPKTTGWRPLPEGLDQLFEAYDRGVQALPPAGGADLPSLPEAPRLGGQPVAGKGKRGIDAAALLERTRALTAVPIGGAMTTAGFEVAAEPVCEPAPECSPCDDEMLMEEAEMEASMDMDMLMSNAMPPPAPQAMAKPAPAPRRSGHKSKKKAERRKERAVSLSMKSMAGGMPGGAGASAGMVAFHGEDEFTTETPGLAASRDALQYLDLRMKGPKASSLRGQLKASSLQDRLVDGLEGAPGEMIDAVRGLPSDIWASLLAHSTQGRLQVALPRHAVGLEQSAGHFAVRYPMESLGSVPPDGQLHAMSLLRRRGQVRRIFRCVPLVDDSVYQVAEFENPLELPLLAGPVRVYRGGDYVVTAPLWTTPPGKLLTVNLGVEQGIMVARNVHFHESTEGLFGGDTALVHRVEIEVRSRLAAAARVEVFERLPVSSDDDIKVELISSSPTAKEYDQSDRGRLVKGGLVFAFDLAPHKAQTCKLEYRITIPSKRVLTGGNRRD